MKKKAESYGKVGIEDVNGFREIDIVEFLSGDFRDGRKVSVYETEESSFIMLVENPETSGRAIKSEIHLSKESFIALMSMMHLFLDARGRDLNQLLQQEIKQNEITYSCSNTLTKNIEMSTDTAKSKN